MDKVTDTTNWDSVDALTDADIAKAVQQDPDAAPLEARGLKRLHTGGRPRQAVTKQSTTIRLSPDVLSYFRSTGKGWQTRIDTVLKEYVKDHKHG